MVITYVQTRELQYVVGKELYEKLVKRIRDAEVAHRKNDTADEELLAAGLEIRLCPKCKTRLEKNEGCPCVQPSSFISLVASFASATRLK